MLTDFTPKTCTSWHKSVAPGFIIYRGNAGQPRLTVCACAKFGFDSHVAACHWPLRSAKQQACRQLCQLHNCLRSLHSYTPAIGREDGFIILRGK